MKIQPILSEIAIHRFIEKFHTEPTWFNADYVQLAKLIKARPNINEPEFDERYQHFLESPNLFHKEQGGSLKFFATHYDAFIHPVARNGNGHVRKLGGEW